MLLLARSDAALQGQELPGGMAAVALVTLTEQVRPDAKDTLDYFKEQGVRVKIISGDNLRAGSPHQQGRGLAWISD